jgi:hypothetical protein
MQFSLEALRFLLEFRSPSRENNKKNITCFFKVMIFGTYLTMYRTGTRDDCLQFGIAPIQCTGSTVPYGTETL